MRVLCIEWLCHKTCQNWKQRRALFCVLFLDTTALLSIGVLDDFQSIFPSYPCGLKKQNEKNHRGLNCFLVKNVNWLLTSYK